MGVVDSGWEVKGRGFISYEIAILLEQFVCQKKKQPMALVECMELTEQVG